MGHAYTCISTLPFMCGRDSQHRIPFGMNFHPLISGMCTQVVTSANQHANGVTLDVEVHKTTALKCGTALPVRVSLYR